MKYDKQDLIREFEFEDARCNRCLGFMYQILQFAFAAIVAIVVFIFGTERDKEILPIVLFLVVPACLYICGVLYAYNAYALAVCGVRAERLHTLLTNCCSKSGPGIETITIAEDDKKLLQKYVLGKRGMSLLNYGVPLGCFLVVPGASIIFGTRFPSDAITHSLLTASWIIYGAYLAIMVIAVYHIATPHFSVNQKIRKGKLVKDDAKETAELLSSSSQSN